MSAEAATIFTIVFPDPALGNPDNEVYDDLPPDISFEYDTQDTIRTLSTNGLPDDDVVKGLLFVPELTSDECKNAIADLIPANVTRRANLSVRDYKLIAVAPWTKPKCVQEFFSGTRATATHGFIFYLPDNSTTIPPTANNAVWGLNDGGQWKRDNIYPVWALPGAAGAAIMNNLALYSGNVTQVPHGHDLAAMYPPSDFVRLYGLIQLGERSTLPSLWVFLLITLGLLVLIIVATSLILHLVHRRRRKALRQRIVNGELDLEALGIKRLTVPQEILDTMPTYAYQPENAAQTLLPKEIDPHAGSPESASDSTVSIINGSSPVAFSQPSCAICLDEFEIGETIVRELPCRHIFHPNCVDEYLLTSSSLCPACRHSALPVGYCPAVITNSMVRRERQARRQRERAAATAAMITASETGHYPQTGPRAALRGAFAAFRPRGQRTTTLPMTSRRAGTPSGFSQRSSRENVEMTSSLPPITIPASTLDGQQLPPASAAPRAVDTSFHDPCPRPDTEDLQGRREWARQRALELIGVVPHTQDLEEQREREQGRMRKLFSKIFPTS